MLGFLAHAGSFRQAVCQPAIWSSAQDSSTFGALLVYMLLWGVMEWGTGGLVAAIFAVYRPYLPCGGLM